MVVFEEDRIIEETNNRLKYLAGIEIDPTSNKFQKDLKELSDIFLSIELTTGKKNKANYISSTVNELTRKTLKNLIEELQNLKKNTIKPIMHSNINFDEKNDGFPEYYGVPQYTPQVIEQQSPHVNYNEEKSIKYNIKSTECKLQENNGLLYYFSTGLENISKLKFLDIKFENLFFNIDNTNNSFIINNKIIKITEGNYKSITQVIQEIEKNIKNQNVNVKIELNKLNNKVSFYLEKNNSTILSKSQNNTNSNKIIIEFNSYLNNILGFSETKYTEDLQIEGEKSARLNLVEDIYLNVLINGSDYSIQNEKINIKNHELSDIINHKFTNKVININPDTLIEYILIKFSKDSSSNENYSIKDNTFELNFEYYEQL